jgi:hypothetical protein
MPEKGIRKNEKEEEEEEVCKNKHAIIDTVPLESGASTPLCTVSQQLDSDIDPVNSASKL